MKDPAIVAAVVSAIVTLLGGSITFCLNLWRTRKEIRHAELKASEEIEVELIKQRLECYLELMITLKRISTQTIKCLDHDQLKHNVSGVHDAIHNHIFGRFGLIARHETRETVIRLRAKCLRFIDGIDTIEQVKKASWETHQMLRSDLGLSQPNLLSAIDRLHRSQLAGTETEIEALLARIHHNEWKS